MLGKSICSRLLQFTWLYEFLVIDSGGYWWMNNFVHQLQCSWMFTKTLWWCPSKQVSQMLGCKTLPALLKSRSCAIFIFYHMAIFQKLCCLTYHNLNVLYHINRSWCDSTCCFSPQLPGGGVHSRRAKRWHGRKRLYNSRGIQRRHGQTEAARESEQQEVPTSTGEATDHILTLKKKFLWHPCITILQSIDSSKVNKIKKTFYPRRCYSWYVCKWPVL